MSVRWTLMAVSAVLAGVCMFMICYADGSDADPAPNQCGNTLYWSMSEGCVTFSGSGDMWDYAPAAERGWKDCSSVILPNELTHIGNNAFFDCASLASVTIPDSVTSIGDLAFFGCSSLESVIIPDSVTSIGTDAFRNCSSLASVTIPDSVTSIGNGAFSNCSSLASVTIPDSVTSIGTDAFQGCNSLTTLYIPCNNPLGITANDSVNNGGISQNVDEDNLFPFHDYSATYTWADDGSACTVRVFCENCDYLAGIEHPAVNSVVKIPATETEMGTTEYSVSGTVEGYQYSSVKDIQDIPPTGKPGGGNDNTLLYIAAGGAIAAVALIGGAFVLLRRP